MIALFKHYEIVMSVVIVAATIHLKYSTLYFMNTNQNMRKDMHLYAYSLFFKILTKPGK
jgi:hypothetical protein